MLNLDSKLLQILVRLDISRNRIPNHIGALLAKLFLPLGIHLLIRFCFFLLQP